MTASTVANIGPGIDFYFAFGVIAVTAGVAAPLTILAAGVAVVLLAFTVAEFTKVEPSAGSFITYVETSLGPRAGVATALLVAVGYTVAMAGVFTMSGGMVALTLAHYTSWNPPWEPLTLVLTAGAIWLTARGVKLSTTAVGVAVLVQVAIMVVVCVVVLVDQRAHLSATPFSWSHLTGGLTGLSAGFPLALYMFIGWENGPALAEECRDPRRTVPRALYISIAIGAALFVFFAYATVTGFHYDVSSIGRSSVPFLTVADHYLGGAAVLAWLAGIVSVLATLVAGANSQARMLFDGGRSGLLPGVARPAAPSSDTPVNALLVMAVVGLGIIGVWWWPTWSARTGIDEPRRPVCRVLDDGHDRDPLRLLLDDALPAGVHVAPPPGLVLRSSARGDPDPRVPDPDRPVRRAVSSPGSPRRTASSRTSHWRSCSGGRGRLHHRAPPPVHRLRRRDDIRRTVIAGRWLSRSFPAPSRSHRRDTPARTGRTPCRSRGRSRRRRTRWARA